MSSKIKFEFSTFRSGLLMGMADAVPGVSGGTIALILGIYNKLNISYGEAYCAQETRCRTFLIWAAMRANLLLCL